LTDCDLLLPLAGWSAQRREDLLKLLSQLDARIGSLDAAVEQAARQQEQARLLMTQPGVVLTRCKRSRP